MELLELRQVYVWKKSWYIISCVWPTGKKPQSTTSKTRADTRNSIHDMKKWFLFSRLQLSSCTERNGAKRHLTRFAFRKRCIASMMWSAPVCISSIIVYNISSFSIQCSSRPTNLTFRAWPRWFLVHVVKWGIPKADWSASSAMMEQNSESWNRALSLLSW